ncbi:BrnT family toxin [Luteibacter aegosomatissinici]|uniref:BrnT family toxin n=1 Tax=Luteibacter aegosomatissinici TaxID=2911539 RepID=UPI001FF8DC80|nr:BrnT family toxin [Luteibacter aegosomatissinici]UPG95726.1 BrnT family toxin [Luteibacter aegosomatissinici]
MEIRYDQAKHGRNLRERGLSFDDVAQFDFSTALVRRDARMDYGEERFVALGLIDIRVHVVVFTRSFRGIRVISFRKANKREVRHYENNQAFDNARG